MGFVTGGVGPVVGAMELGEKLGWLVIEDGGGEEAVAEEGRSGAAI